MPHAFSIVFPEVKYTGERPRRKLLQMALVSICIGTPASGKSFTILLEYCHGIDYSKLSIVINGMVSSLASRNPQALLHKNAAQRSAV